MGRAEFDNEIIGRAENTRPDLRLRVCDYKCGNPNANLEVNPLDVPLKQNEWPKLSRASVLDKAAPNRRTYIKLINVNTKTNRIDALNI